MEDDEPRLLDLQANRQSRRIRIGRPPSSWSGRPVNLAFLGLLFRTGREIGRQSVTVQSLRHSQERFQGIFDAAPFGIALVDPDWKWLEVNRSLCVILGYQRGVAWVGCSAASPPRRPRGRPCPGPTDPRRRNLLLPDGEAVHSQAGAGVVDRPERFAGPRRRGPSAAYRETDGGHHAAQAGEEDLPAG